MSKRKNEFDITLESLNADYFVNNDSIFRNYVIRWLTYKKKIITFPQAAKDILKKHYPDEGSPNFIEQVALDLKSEVPQQKYDYAEYNGMKVLLHVNCRIVISPKDKEFFGYFFFYFLSKKSSFFLSDFLNYHLHTSYPDSYEKYDDFLKKGILIFGRTAGISEDKKILIHQWIEENDADSIEEKLKGKSKSDSGTTAQQVLFMHYIYNALNVKNVDNSKKADVTKFLTGKTYKTIYDNTRLAPNISPKLTTSLSDHEIIKMLFSTLKLPDLAQEVEKSIDQLRKRIRASR